MEAQLSEIKKTAFGAAGPIPIWYWAGMSSSQQTTAIFLNLFPCIIFRKKNLSVFYFCSFLFTSPHNTPNLIRAQTNARTHKGRDRKSVEVTLQGQPEGTYLIRDSTSAETEFVLSVSENKKVSHYIIQRTGPASFTLSVSVPGIQGAAVQMQ